MTSYNLVGSQLEHILVRGDNTAVFVSDSNQLHSRNVQALYADRHTPANTVQQILLSFAQTIIPLVPYIAEQVGVSQSDIMPNIFAIIVSDDGSGGVMGYASLAGEVVLYSPGRYPSKVTLIRHLGSMRPQL
jgi:hypothetical protein